MQRGGDRLRRGQRGDLVAGEILDERRSVFGALAMGKSRCRLDQIVVDLGAGERTGEAEATDGEIDQVRVDRAQRVVADADAFGHTRTEVLYEHVGVRRQFAHHVVTLCASEIDRDRALAPVGQLEHGGDAVAAGRDVSGQVARTRCFDLDHRRALVGEERRGHWTRQHRRQVDDANTAEWTIG